jgi:Zn-dependent peptidase ImmA (M78 family)
MTRKWPALPKRIQGLAGPIRVIARRVESFPAEDGDMCWGLYKPAKREIHIANRVPPALRWHTLLHEAAHAWLLDAGIVNILHGSTPAELDRNVELVCDSVASFAVRAFVARTGIDPFAP